MVATGQKNAFYSLTPEKLNELAKDKYSLIKVEKKDLTLPMPPYTLDKVYTAINKIIKYEWTYKYSLDLQGILLYHDEFEFRSDYGMIKDDSPYIFWDISARFYAFCPQQGFIIRGKVNKFTKTQVINALVLNCIIAALTPDKIHPTIRDSLMLGQEILFRIESFDSDNSLVYGVIDDECTSLMQAEDMLKRDDEAGGDGEVGTIDDLYKS